MKLRSKTLRKGFTLIELLVVIAILGALAGVSYGIFSFLNSGAKQAAATNMGQIATALGEFKKANASRFPGDDTAKKYEDDKNCEQYAPFRGDYSNDYFHQLFACPQSRKSIDETQFYADIPGVEEGDGDISQGECLKANENAFAYVMKNDKKKGIRVGVPSNSSAKNCPLMFCCVKTDEGVMEAPKLHFDLEAFDNYAIMITTSGKVVPLEVDDGLNKDDDTTGSLSKDHFPKDSKTKTSYIGDYVIVPPAL